MSNEQAQEKVGLQHLDDETLAEIAAERDRHGEMSYEAKIAFQELARRSGVET
jgi:hypothetical protein